MFGIDLPELIVIMMLALILFGPQKLPEIGQNLGRMVRKFREASAGIQQSLRQHTQPGNFASSSPAADTAFCASCGHPLNSEYTFCPACGRRLKPEVGYPPPPSPPPPAG